MSSGYFNNEEETKKNFIDGWYHTGFNFIYNKKVKSKLLCD